LCIENQETIKLIEKEDYEKIERDFEVLIEKKVQ
jgi:hypothetical protein